MKIFTLLVLGHLAFCSADSVKLTYYWIVHETDFALGDDATLATCPDNGGVTLGKVSKQFAERIAAEGSGYLRDGTTFLSLSSCVGDDNSCHPSDDETYHCFERGTEPIGSQDNPLVPFVSVASNDHDFGATGIIHALVGKHTPHGDTHNGCVRVDDTCSTCDQPNWLDFYSYSKTNAQFFESSWIESDLQVDFEPQNCDVLQYSV